MRRVFIPLLLALVALLGMNAGAYASTQATPENGSLLDFAQPVFDAIMAGQYLAAAGFALVLTVAAVKHYAGSGRFGKFVHSDPGGVLTTFAMSFFGAFATAAAATGSGWSGLTFEVLKASWVVSFAAILGYVGVKKLVLPLLQPLLQPLMDKAPSWMQPFFKIVLWAFDRKLGTAKTEAEVAKDGQDAVDAKPSTGVDGVLGTPTEVR